MKTKKSLITSTSYWHSILPYTSISWKNSFHFMTQKYQNFRVGYNVLVRKARPYPIWINDLKNLKKGFFLSFWVLLFCIFVFLIPMCHLWVIKSWEDVLKLFINSCYQAQTPNLLFMLLCENQYYRCLKMIIKVNKNKIYSSCHNIDSSTWIMISGDGIFQFSEMMAIKCENLMICIIMWCLI
jgi:hypothetical protein